jgi:flagellar basal-body rod protein FlgG
MPSSALYVARTGLQAQDARMQVISNNLANVSTTGFKRERANFATLAYQDARVAGQQSSGQTTYATGLNLGTGVTVQGTSTDMTQGTMQSTGNALDMAISGEGYFQVTMPDGTTGYTRAGNFTTSPEGLLETAQGYPVVPQITIPQGAGSITVGQDGTVSAVLPGATTSSTLGQITTATFANPSALQASSDNFYKETAGSGAPQVAAAGTTGHGTVVQSYLEASNVSVVTEMVDMIECQRAYEVNSKMISAVDEMLKNANQTLS